MARVTFLSPVVATVTAILSRRLTATHRWWRRRRRRQKHSELSPLSPRYTPDWPLQCAREGGRVPPVVRGVRDRSLRTVRGYRVTHCEPKPPQFLPFTAFLFQVRNKLSNNRGWNHRLALRKIAKCRVRLFVFMHRIRTIVKHTHSLRSSCCAEPAALETDAREWSTLVTHTHLFVDHIGHIRIIVQSPHPGTMYLGPAAAGRGVGWLLDRCTRSCVYFAP